MIAAEDVDNSFRETVYNSMRPFFGYLDTAIRNLENKEVKCKWELLHLDGWKITAGNKLFRIDPCTKIKLQNIISSEGWFEVSIQEEENSSDLKMFSSGDHIEWGQGKDHKIHEITDSEIKRTHNGLLLLNIPEKNISSARWKGYDLCCTPIPVFNLGRIDFKINGNPAENNPIGEDLTFIINQPITQTDVLEINDIKTEFQILDSFNENEFFKNNSDSFRDAGDIYLSSKNKPTFDLAKVFDITEETLNSLNIQDLKLDDKVLSSADWGYSEKVLCPLHKGLSLRDKLLTHQKYPMFLLKVEANTKSEKWIQLIDCEEDTDSFSRLSLEYFFDDNVSIYSTEKKDEKNKLYPIRKNQDEFQILLSDTRNGNKSCVPSSEFLYLKPDMGELINQKNALRTIENTPFPENLPLLKLMEKREVQNWPIFEPLTDFNESEWKVLTDPSYDGCEEQRKFVLTALNTPDFAILDGPPGTGKTTTILELIIQLILQNKRVLLAASTNAAINNVLERLREKFLDSFHIHATRLGLSDKAVNVSEFVLDEQIQEYCNRYNLTKEEASHLIIESSNLICGTTNGIHRLFNRTKESEISDSYDSLTRGGIPFDVMIIDECSKTTFQEFLVPARLAKKWILVGDVRQLSPFTDREQIETNLNEIKEMTPGLKNACFLWNQFYPFDERVIIPISSETMNSLMDECVSRFKIYSNSEKSKDQIQNFSKVRFFSKDEHFDDVEELYQKNVIFIEKNLLGKYSYLLPKDSLLISDDWETDPHTFSYFSSRSWSNYNSEKSKRIRKSKNKKHGENINHEYCSQTVSEILHEKNWATEICWRLERKYWLRYLPPNNKQKSVEELPDYFPKTVPSVKNSVYRIRNMAFPSILESLSGSGMDVGNEKTTLTSGFSKEELECRLVTLKYQHRMHSSISKTPRDLFYSDESGRKQARSLLNGRDVDKRDWTEIYPARNLWIHCEGTVHKNGNEKEAKRIVDEIKKKSSKLPKKMEIAILTFYKGQERVIRDKLRELTGQKNSYSKFEYESHQIKLATVDYFQGQEADIIFLSMVNTYRDGFLDTPNRLNVAITRSKHQMVIVGNYHYFSERAHSDQLRTLAKQYE
jgi:Superfamily I DNA and RNA helicases and helicase subunits